ncbi:hypothetical protein LQ772_12015 [Frateuria edaphi]|uniref:hypothetical protein n=1 Tax=Frateuria edaphi TaxID=2898793 RepID=UPI001E5DA9CC|nr:hypothetical protein [Frateuria edaphi]UGB44713.1 hypothetical protein LQ772_12015 [Frateuria edaphi]
MTQDRLNSYQVVFAPRDDIELFGAYLWNGHVCSCFHPLITAVEVALRNSVDTALAGAVNPFWWQRPHLRYLSYSTTGVVPHAVKCVKENFAKANNNVRRDKMDRYGVRNCTPSRSEIVAKTEFSTWEFIFDPEFNGPGLFWPAHLGKVFRGDWGHLTTSQLLMRVRVLIEIVRKFRNRASHHEPIWKKFGVASAPDAMRHLHERIDEFKELISLIHPEKLKLLQVNGVLSALERACSLDELRYFQHQGATHKVNSVLRLREITKTCVLNNARAKIVVRVNGRPRKIQLGPA